MDKLCSRCKQRKPFELFPKDRNRSDGYSYWCKQCRKEYNQIPTVKASRQAWEQKRYTEDSEYRAIRVRSSKISQDKLMADPVRKEKKNAKGRLYDRERRKDPIVQEKERLYNVEYVRRPEVIEHRKKKRDDKMKNHPTFKIEMNLRRRIRSAIKDGYGERAFKTIELIGCSWLEVREHLESQFTEGMTWDNYGKWHQDHIRPCASFDLRDPIQQQECFHYTNLQPLWAFDNMSKGSKVS